MQVNMKNGLYRGIFSEVAREMGVDRATVKKGYDRRVPRFVQAVTRKISERNRIMRAHDKAVKEEIQEKDRAEREERST